MSQASVKYLEEADEELKTKFFTGDTKLMGKMDLATSHMEEGISFDRTQFIAAM